MIPNLIIPTLKRYDSLQKLLSSIDFPIGHVVIIDNGNMIDQLRLPAEIKELTVLTMPANLGVASSWNLGIKCFPHDSVWFMCSDDVEFEPGALEAWFEASAPDRLVTSEQWPHYRFFSVGEDVIDRVGLFDEALHPKSFEDTDFEWRASELGFDALRVAVDHNRNGLEKNVEKTNKFYPLNEIYFRYKQSQGDLSAGEWSLERRRINSLD